MGVYGVKATAPGLICRGYPFKPAPYVNRCEAAEVRACGFHFAENPLDCLSYYETFVDAEFWYVEGGGELHEITGDSKIACTEIRFLERLDVVNFLVLSAVFIKDHPRLDLSAHVCRDEGLIRRGSRNRFVLVAGKEPIGCGTRIGDVLCLVKRDADTGEVLRIWLSIVDGESCKPDVWYDAEGGVTHGRGHSND